VYHQAVSIEALRNDGNDTGNCGSDRDRAGIAFTPTVCRLSISRSNSRDSPIVRTDLTILRLRQRESKFTQRG